VTAAARRGLIETLYSELLRRYLEEGVVRTEEIKRLFTGLHPAEFGQVFRVAVDYLRDQNGVDLRPTGAGDGVLVKATAEQSLKRCRRDRRAASKKLVRGHSKAALAGKAADPETAAAAAREERKFARDRVFLHAPSSKKDLSSLFEEKPKPKARRRLQA
jgi:hypothetical protein